MIEESRTNALRSEKDWTHGGEEGRGRKYMAGLDAAAEEEKGREG